MILGSNIQKVYLGNQEISKILFQNTEIFSSIQIDPYLDYVTLLAHFNTDFSDSSTNNFTLSAFGNTFIDIIIPRFGSGCVRLDGNGDYLQIEDNEAFGFGTGDFTIEMWVFPQDLIFADYNPIIDLRTGPGSNGVIITCNPSGNVTVFNPGGPQTGFTSINTLQGTTWNHLVVQRKNAQWQIYINGSLDSSTVVGGNNLESSRPCFIGTFANTFGPTARYFRGQLDDIRITKGIARYTGGSISVPTSQYPDPVDPYISNVSLLLHMDGTNSSQTFVDSSSNNFSLSAFGNAQVSTVTKKFGNGAAYFDGVGSYLSASKDPAFDMPGDFTVEFWHYPLTFNTSDPAICLYTNRNFGNSSTVPAILVSLLPTSGRYQFSFGNSASVVPISPLLNQWNHFALVRSNNILSFYSNGVKIEGQNTFSDALTSSSCLIGAALTNNTSIFDEVIGHYQGYIDEFRITKGIARYASNFVPQTAPFTEFAEPISYNSFTNNLLAYWSFDDSSFQPSYGIYSAALNGGAWTVTNGVYNLGARLAPGQRIRAEQSLWNVRTNPLSYTVSFWVRKNATNTTGQQAVMLGSFFGEMGFVFMNQFLNGSNLNNAFSFTLATGASYQYKAAEAVQTMNNNTWYHLVGTYSLPNETAKLYVNGTLTATTTGVLNNNYTNDGWTGFAMNGSVIGSSSSEYGNDYTFDMVGLWDRLLTSEEVEQLYLNYKPINDFII